MSETPRQSSFRGRVDGLPSAMSHGANFSKWELPADLLRAPFDASTIQVEVRYGSPLEIVQLMILFGLSADQVCARLRDGKIGTV